MSAPSNTRWEAVSMDAADRLEDARAQLHWAVQLLGSWGSTLAVSRPDDSHTATTWDTARRRFVSTAARASELRLTFDPVASMVVLADPKSDGQRFGLAGRTLEEAARWIAEALSARGDGPGTFEFRPGAIPAHPVGRGARFGPDPDACAELTRWYQNSRALLDWVLDHESAAQPVRCWPHHFDQATLIIEEGTETHPTKTLGVGMTPGDELIPEPYLYVVPWPRPETLEPASLTYGLWHDEGWLGAVLRAPELIGEGAASGQAERARAFVREALSALRGDGGRARPPTG